MTKKKNYAMTKKKNYDEAIYSSDSDYNETENADESIEESEVVELPTDFVDTSEQDFTNDLIDIDDNNDLLELLDKQIEVEYTNKGRHIPRTIQVIIALLKNK